MTNSINESRYGIIYGGLPHMSAEATEKRETWRRAANEIACDLVDKGIITTKQEAYTLYLMVTRYANYQLKYNDNADEWLKMVEDNNGKTKWWTRAIHRAIEKLHTVEELVSQGKIEMPAIRLQLLSFCDGDAYEVASEYIDSDVLPLVLEDYASRKK